MANRWRLSDVDPSRQSEIRDILLDALQADTWDEDGMDAEKITIELDPTSRSVRIDLEDFDDEDFRQLMQALSVHVQAAE